MITAKSEPEIISDLRDFYISEIKSYRDKFPSDLKMADSIMVSWFSLEQVRNYEFHRIQKLYYRIYPDREIRFEKIEIPTKKNGRPFGFDIDTVSSQVKKCLSEGIHSTKIHKSVGFDSYGLLRKYLSRNGKGFRELKKEIEGL